MSKVSLGTDHRTLSRPAWNSDSMNPEKPILTHTSDGKPAPVFVFKGMSKTMSPQTGLQLPVYALIRTTRAVYARAQIIHESRQDFQIVYTVLSKKKTSDKRSETIEKKDIRTFRILQN